MAHIPKAFCFECRQEMVIEKNGEMLKVKLYNGQSYYKIHTDRWRCPNCDKQIYTGLARNPISHHFEENFNELKHDDEVYLQK